ncbi:hypothetical protein IW261DRAFT_733221 [Armillaria novae-zelandiae]|uniref:Uncharacterized protein n=1 Tax=Armillaria novae-zelandiae TaxID=153914 RepID=A0AA39TXJ6_9AGAR|nr:hypothetical protein IW261DRAFT_733221 [Armillaria novae-zelandiae]
MAMQVQESISSGSILIGLAFLSPFLPFSVLVTLALHSISVLRGFSLQWDLHAASANFWALRILAMLVTRTSTWRHL